MDELLNSDYKFPLKIFNRRENICIILASFSFVIFLTVFLFYIFSENYQRIIHRTLSPAFLWFTVGPWMIASFILSIRASIYLINRKLRKLSFVFIFLAILAGILPEISYLVALSLQHPMNITLSKDGKYEFSHR